MAAYIAKRLLAAIPVLFGLSIIVFLIMAMIPGDPATAILGSYATPENVAALNEDLGLDKSLPQQYLIWLGNILQGDFGRSYALNRPVLDEVLERFSATLILAGTALVLCSLLGLLAGVVSAVRQYGWTDRIVTLLVPPPIPVTTSSWTWPPRTCTCLAAAVGSPRGIQRPARGAMWPRTNCPRRSQTFPRVP
jgi:peptide/nickel transport system permease protein